MARRRRAVLLRRRRQRCRSGHDLPRRPGARTRRPLLDNARVAAALSAAADTAVGARDLPVGALVDDERAMQFDVRGHAYRCTLATGACAPAPVSAPTDPRAPEWVSRSPDGQWDAFVWNFNVYVRPARLTNADPAAWLPVPPLRFRLGCDAPAFAGLTPPRDSMPLPNGAVALTTDGTDRWGYGLYYFGLEVGHVESSRFRLESGNVRWSPDSKRLVIRRDDLRGVRTYPLYSSTSNQPIDHTYFYAAPGDVNVPRFAFVVLDPTTHAATPVQLPAIGLLNNPGDARWQTSDELTVLSSTRGSKTVTLSAVDARTGTPRTIVRDSSATNVDFDNADWAMTNGGSDVFWVSERDGWAHIYRFAKDGTLKNQVTRGTFVVGGISRVDSVARQLYFTAWGKATGVPYYTHLYRIGFDGSGMTDVTPETGYHTVRFAPNGSYFLDMRETIDTPPVTVLRAANGRQLLELGRGDAAPLRAAGWTPAEVFTVKARDGETDLWGIIHRPSNFDPSKQYPIVTNVYPGPQMGSVREWTFKGADSRDGLNPPSSGIGSTPARVWSGDGWAARSPSWGSSSSSSTR